MEIEQVYEKFRESGLSLCTDSRLVKPGDFFVALPGETFDGNQFASVALEKGARYAVVSKSLDASDNRYLVVDDTLECFQSLARYHRNQFSIPVICIGGSNGKTTTKELLAATLSKKYNVLATKGNYNNHVGVPLTLLGIRPEHEIAVLEIGANHAGEHVVLGNLVCPTHLVVTNNGKDHLEGFGSPEGVRKANAELFDIAVQYHSQVFLHADQNDLLSDAISKGLHPTVFGASDTYVLNPGSTVSLAREGEIVSSQLVGDYNVPNILTALVLAESLGVSRTDAALAIGEYVPELNRSQRVVRDGITYVLDCYNANPSSMRASLQSFFKTARHPRAVVLGDMLEMGSYAAAEHQEMINFLETQLCDAVFLIGKNFSETSGLPNALRFSDSVSARGAVQDFLKPNWTVLLKGSRGIAVERVLDLAE